MDNDNKYIKELVNVLTSIKDKKLLEEFMKDILTPAELKEIPLRLQIIKRLAKGIPQRKIVKDLGVGLATVTRGSKELRNKKGGFYKIASNLHWWASWRLGQK